MPGSPTNGGSHEEQGKLIHFPRASWVPDDGIEPLTGGSQATQTLDPAAAEPDAGSDEPDRRRDLSTFEAGEFWDSGDTQELVGGATASATATVVIPGSGSLRAPDTDASSSDSVEQYGTPSPADQRGHLSPRPPLRAALIAPVMLALAALAAGLVVLFGTGGSTHRVATHLAVQRNPLTATADQLTWTLRDALREERARAAGRRSNPAHRHIGALPKVVQARYSPPTQTAASTPTYSQGEFPSAGSTDQTGVVAASADRSPSSTSAPTQAAGPVGPGALTGAGSTPSG